jgi:hypothetical protein
LPNNMAFLTLDRIARLHEERKFSNQNWSSMKPKFFSARHCSELCVAKASLELNISQKMEKSVRDNLQLDVKGRETIWCQCCYWKIVHRENSTDFCVFKCDRNCTLQQTSSRKLFWNFSLIVLDLVFDLNFILVGFFCIGSDGIELKTMVMTDIKFCIIIDICICIKGN